ncbi:hypothetical protein QUF72_06915 [Desulfobacterales bacterium HSG2]|nr:hypothetical protein [Desulfobacterales bacterium HSG2]
MSSGEQEKYYLNKVSEVYNRLSMKGLPESDVGLHEVSLEKIFIKLSVRIRRESSFSRHTFLEEIGAGTDEKYSEQLRALRELSRAEREKPKSESLTIADTLHRYRRKHGPL